MSSFLRSDSLRLPAGGRAAADAGAVRRLIDRCLAGEEFAYEALYNQYAAGIYRLCFNLLQQREDAEEVLQDSFEYAFRRLSHYKPEKSAFRTWLYRIAISRCRNKRRRKMLPTLPLQMLPAGDVRDASALDPHELAALGEEQRRVWAALKALSPKLRETAVLRYYNALSYAEIGAILGTSAKTIESRMRLAHKALRTLLQDEGGGSGDEESRRE